MNRNQKDVIEYLGEEIRVLKDLVGKKPWFNDGQRRRLAIKGNRLGRPTLDRCGLTGRGHLRALIAGFPKHALTTATCFSFMRI
jgi:hypothetical protein